MITLITGGSKCGKSRLAEKIAESSGKRKIYIATMQPYGEEAYAAIERHRKIRAGKGYETIEKYTDLHEISIPENCAVLLECAGNLCANEMFRNGEIIRPADSIAGSILDIGKKAEELIVVTNQVGSDGVSYDEGTAEYIRQLGRINLLVARGADCVVECVYGIPVVLKGALRC